MSTRLTCGQWTSKTLRGVPIRINLFNNDRKSLCFKEFKLSVKEFSFVFGIVIVSNTQLGLQRKTLVSK